MLTLRHIAIHHFGGTQADPFASTQHLSVDTINTSHRERWPDFPSQYIPRSFIGYNLIIFDDGGWAQGRAVGESTAAVKGFNDTTLSICLAGNFSRIRGGTTPVDQPTRAQKDTLRRLLKAAIDNTMPLLGIVVVPGTVLNFAIPRIQPHRAFGAPGGTECFGTALPDSWARDIIIGDVRDQLGILQDLLSTYLKLRDVLTKRSLAKQAVGSRDYRECEGIIK